MEGGGITDRLERTMNCEQVRYLVMWIPLYCLQSPLVPLKALVMMLLLSVHVSSEEWEVWRNETCRLPMDPIVAIV